MTTIFQRIREVHRESRIINNIPPQYLILSKAEYEELIDYCIEEELIDVLSSSDTPVILGMKIIPDEKSIIRLQHGTHN